MSIFYFTGAGVPKDDRRAFEWTEKAATAGDSQSMYNMGVLYEQGVVIKRDYQHAISWYQKAAAAGNSDAMVNIAVPYSTGPASSKTIKKLWR